MRRLYCHNSSSILLFLIVVTVHTLSCITIYHQSMRNNISNGLVVHYYYQLIFNKIDLIIDTK